LITVGRPAEAIVECRETLRLKPGSWYAYAAHLHLSDALRVQGLREEGLVELNQALQVRPKTRGDLAIGRVLLHWGKYDLAEAEYREAARLEPDNVWARRDFGRALEKMGKLAEAEVELSAALKLWPGDRYIQDCLARVGDLNKRAQEFLNAIRVRPADGSTRTRFADWLLSHGWLSEAEAQARAAIRVEPRLAVARCMLGEILYRSRRPSEAEVEFQAAVGLDPDLAPLQYRIAYSYVVGSDWVKAAAAFARYVERNPDDGNAWCQYAALLLLTGRPADHARACATMRERLAAGKDTWFVYMMARACSLGAEAGSETARLVVLMERIVNHEPPAPYYVHVLAASLYRNRQYERALARVHESMTADPDWTEHIPLNWLLLALAHHRLGHAGEARAWLDRAVRRIDEGGRVASQAEVVQLPMNAHDWMGCLVLRQEAESLIHGAAKPDARAGPTQAAVVPR
jgi:uncharacterized protein (TIGR02996 family)